MVGAYSTFVTQLLFKQPFLKPFYGSYIIVSIFIAFIFSACVGILLERLIIRRLYGNPLETLLATWGVSLLLQQFVRGVPLAIGPGIIITFISGITLKNIINTRFINYAQKKYLDLSIWAFSIFVGILSTNFIASNISRLSRADSRNVDVTAPKWMRGPIEILGETYPKTRLWIIFITLISVIAVLLFLNLSEWGLRIRAVTQNRSMSECLGLSSKKVDTLTFAIGSGLAGVAGVAVSLLGSVGPNVGQNYIVPCFMVVVLGGVGNLLGTVLASFGIGILTDLIGAGRLMTIWPNMPESLANIVNFFATTSMARVMIFTLIIIFLQFKPSGLFPQKGRMVES
jgi:urea transport system permease protein